LHGQIKHTVALSASGTVLRASTFASSRLGLA
jgi:hypothetical protein